MKLSQKVHNQIWESEWRLGVVFFAIAAISASCATKILEYDRVDVLTKNEEYDKKLKVKVIAAQPILTEGMTTTIATPPVNTNPSVESKATLRPGKKVGREKKVKTMGTKGPERRLPEIEDSEGFQGRRPLVDPYRIGEKVTLSLSYFNLTAGYMDLEVLPSVEVNNERAYAFQVSIKSTSFFNRVYAVEDSAVTYVNYETLLPYNFVIDVKESKQLADIRSVFDFKSGKGNYWEKRVTKDKGENSRSSEWEIKPFSQNVISAVYYLRNFTLTPGKKLAFYVGDDGKNVLFTGEVLRREDLETDIGTLKTVVVKPKLEVDGVFKPVGDIMIWLTDDDRKFLVRIESKIKIGTIVGKLKSINPGR